MSTVTLVALCVVAGGAGFIDAVGGGGGLLQVPALLILLPQHPVPSLLGTNKFSSIFGTSAASWRYARSVRIPWATVTPALVAALIGATLGAHLVSHLAAAKIKPLVLTLLVVALGYTLSKPQLGRIHAPRLGRLTEPLTATAGGFALGCYDGFFGPGTGSFLILLFVAGLGFGFLAAAASAKLLNVATNLAALVYFAAHGEILYRVALPMAACNFAGGWIGSHLATRRGSGFVRAVFVIVVCGLILRLGYEVAISLSTATHGQARS